jgi:hypothetical protein
MLLKLLENSPKTDGLPDDYVGLSDIFDGAWFSDAVSAAVAPLADEVLTKADAVKFGCSIDKRLEHWRSYTEMIAKGKPSDAAATTWNVNIGRELIDPKYNEEFYLTMMDEREIEMVKQFGMRFDEYWNWKQKLVAAIARDQGFEHLEIPSGPLGRMLRKIWDYHMETFALGFSG